MNKNICYLLMSYGFKSISSSLKERVIVIACAITYIVIKYI